MCLISDQHQHKTKHNENKVSAIEQNKHSLNRSHINNGHILFGYQEVGPNSLPIQESYSQVKRVQEVDKDKFAPLVPQVNLMVDYLAKVSLVN